MQTRPIRATAHATRRLAHLAAIAVLAAACSSGPRTSSPVADPSVMPGPTASPSAARSQSPSPVATASPATSAAAPTTPAVLASAAVATPTAALASPSDDAAWVPTGAMIEPRAWHAATRLADGRVLVVGGADGAGSFVGPAEIYDPASGRWAPAGSLREPRYGHTATLLPDGTVLVVGGWTPGDELRPTASSERYDPADGSWTAGPTMHEVRAGHTASLLPDGSLLVAGGARYNGGVGDPGAGVEVLRPGARAWVAGSPMHDARADHTATLLADGDLLVVGGLGRETDEAAPFNTALVTAERYDPDLGTWSVTAPLADGRAGHTAVLLGDGRVLVSRMGREGSAALFDPADGRFRTTGDLVDGRFRHTSTRLADGDVLVVGGESYDDELASRIGERYDPRSGSWSRAAAMAGPRVGHTATALEDGRVLVSGGADGEGTLVAVAELFQPGG